jgi:hypothetical protein
VSCQGAPGGHVARGAGHGERIEGETSRCKRGERSRGGTDSRIAARPASSARQHLRAFGVYGFKLPRVQARCVQDRWCNLSREGQRRVIARPHLRRRNQQRHVTVVIREAAVFRQPGASSADHAVVGDRNEVRHAAVVERVPIQRRQVITIEQLGDLQFGGMRQDIGLGVGIVRITGRRATAIG